MSQLPKFSAIFAAMALLTIHFAIFFGILAPTYSQLWRRIDLNSSKWSTLVFKGKHLSWLDVHNLDSQEATLAGFGRPLGPSDDRCSQSWACVGKRDLQEL